MRISQLEQLHLQAASDPKKDWFQVTENIGIKTHMSEKHFSVDRFRKIFHSELSKKSYD